MGFDLYWADYAAAPDDAPRPDGAYLRLSGSGMSVIGREMQAQGMIYRSTFPRFPPWGEYEIPVNEDGEPVESSPGYRAYVAALALVTEAEDPSRPGIPMHKLMTNDDWLVTSNEINGALAEASPEPRVLEDEEEAELWRSWLEFLHAAQAHGGVRVG